MRPSILFATIFLLILSNSAIADAAMENAVRDAISGDKNASTAAIQFLRAEKQVGLNALFDFYSAEIVRTKSGKAEPDNWTAISTALDSVAMQKDAYSSRLYWFTDLAEAKREAAATGRPILSLRLLGNLNEEYSCANSRFFRSILYSDPSIAGILREKYILHWESVRPAPKITIDFGDGRQLVRTITGNSIHYVLDSRGVILDALPGLYTPLRFKDYLNNLNQLASSENFSARTAGFYRTETALAIILDWRNKLELLGKNPDDAVLLPAGAPPSDSISTALDAAPLAVTKSMIELPTVLSFLPEIERLTLTTSANDWKPIANLEGEIRFSPESVALMRRKTSNLNEAEFAAMLENLKTYVALDTAQNEYRFHLRILSWLNPSNASRLGEFNDTVYSDLFLTPGKDKWLGLYSPDIYSAIKNSGIQ